jgi:hypothetical protein
MGWTTTYKSKNTSAKEYIEDNLLVWKSDTYSYRVLDGGVVKFRTYYGAVEKTEIATGNKTVFAVIILLNYYKDGYENFGYKDMSEDMGPVESQCPERILKLLTPTTSQYANEWRQRCWDRINAKKNRPKIVEKMVLQYGGKDYTVIKPLGRRGYTVECDGYQYRMKTSQASQAKILQAA